MSWHDEQDDTPLPEGFDQVDAWPTDGLDRAIRDAARDYNAPTGEVPRDAMWAAIVGARIPVAPDAAPAVVPVTPLRVERTTVRIDRRRTWLGLAAAAAIFLATGVGIGRWWGAGSRGVGQRGAVATQVATITPAITTPIDSVPNAMPNGISNVVPNAPAAIDRAEPRSVPRTLAATRPSTRATGDAYDVAITRHFTQVEALLVSYRRDTVDVALDARLAQWARPLLSSTQVLLDSPAADDPRRRRLLEDLELVLAQVARLSPTSTATDSSMAGADSTARKSVRADRVERQIIDGTLQRAQLLPRIRNLVASGS